MNGFSIMLFWLNRIFCKYFFVFSGDNMRYVCLTFAFFWNNSNLKSLEKQFNSGIMEVSFFNSCFGSSKIETLFTLKLKIFSYLAQISRSSQYCVRFLHWEASVFWLNSSHLHKICQEFLKIFLGNTLILISDDILTLTWLNSLKIQLNLLVSIWQIHSKTRVHNFDMIGVIIVFLVEFIAEVLFFV